MLTVEIRLILIARMCAKDNSSKKNLTDVFETSNNICAMEQWLWSLQFLPSVCDLNMFF